MAKRMEKKSARLLAILLALIMIGSVFAMMPGGNSNNKRDVKYTCSGLHEWMDMLPSGTSQIIYTSPVGTEDERLLDYTHNIINNNYYPEVFSKMGEFQELNGFLVAGYNDGLLYLIDVNRTKLYYSGQEGNYSGFKVKTSNDIMMTPETSPFIIGTQKHVSSSIDLVSASSRSEYSDYVSRVPGEFNVVFMFLGESAQGLMSGNFTDYTDFYMEGIRTNDGVYEKIVAMHFKSSQGGFIDSNVTEYYNHTNYEDNFGTVTMRDSNFTKLLQAQPKMKPVMTLEQVEDEGEMGNESLTINPE
ncbi:MAG: hypothetical protein ACLFO6_04145 [Archaeoglobaceae archaeon]